jgi:hypothetical protein
MAGDYVPPASLQDVCPESIAFAVIGCGGAGQTDPGTAKGTYTVVVTGTAGSGSSQHQTSVNVPITIQ